MRHQWIDIQNFQRHLLLFGGLMLNHFLLQMSIDDLLVQMGILAFILHSTIRIERNPQIQMSIFTRLPATLQDLFIDCYLPFKCLRIEKKLIKKPFSFIANAFVNWSMTDPAELKGVLIPPKQNNFFEINPTTSICEHSLPYLLLYMKPEKIHLQSIDFTITYFLHCRKARGKKI